jgi:hypothetical protein
MVNRIYRVAGAVFSAMIFASPSCMLYDFGVIKMSLFISTKIAATTAQTNPVTIMNEVS